MLWLGWSIKPCSKHSCFFLSSWSRWEHAALRFHGLITPMDITICPISFTTPKPGLDKQTKKKNGTDRYLMATSRAIKAGFEGKPPINFGRVYLYFAPFPISLPLLLLMEVSQSLSNVSPSHSRGNSRAAREKSCRSLLICFLIKSHQQCFGFAMFQTQSNNCLTYISSHLLKIKWHESVL